MAVRQDTPVYGEFVSCFHAHIEEGHPTSLRYNRLLGKGTMQKRVLTSLL